MKILKNVKNLFFEEEELEKEEEKSEKDLTKEKPEEKPEKKLTEAVSERDLFQTEPTFKFPVIFDNEELEAKEVEKEKPKIVEKKKEPEVKKDFKVSPIISPVYGILEKNYKKEEVKTRDGLLDKQEKSFDLDSVRKRAFEEKITTEKKLTREQKYIDKEDNKEEEKELDLFEEKKVEELDNKMKTIDELLKESNEDFYSLVDSMYEGDDE